ncbi:MAG: glycosyltransferase, partial [Lachnospiraceae bacterium]|nr:glycosyltransferase [Lachnospiraceae bacterium]
MTQADVIIPVYKPSEKLIFLLEGLKRQTHPASRIILINTEQKYFDKFIAGTDFKERFKDVLVKHISKEEFDHGGTRNYGVSLSEAPFFIMMTDDAVPADDKMMEQLLKPFEDKKVGMSYGRQLAGKESGMIESYTRIFNYPGESCVKSAKNLKTMGIKTFFASNVCAAYRRDIFDELKGFTSHTI